MADYTFKRVEVDGRLSCPCGCGDTPKGKRTTFCMGHDARLRERIIRAHLLEKTVAITSDDGRTREGSALEIAEMEYNWQHYLEQAKQRVDLACGTLIKKAKGNPRLEKLGKTDEFPVVAVYRNKNGSCDLESIDRLGHKHWRHVDAEKKEKAA